MAVRQSFALLSTSMVPSQQGPIATPLRGDDNGEAADRAWQSTAITVNPDIKMNLNVLALPQGSAKHYGEDIQTSTRTSRSGIHSRDKSVNDPPVIARKGTRRGSVNTLSDHRSSPHSTQKRFSPYSATSRRLSLSPVSSRTATLSSSFVIQLPPPHSSSSSSPLSPKNYDCPAVSMSSDPTAQHHKVTQSFSVGAHAQPTGHSPPPLHPHPSYEKKYSMAQLGHGERWRDVTRSNCSCRVSEPECREDRLCISETFTTTSMPIHHRQQYHHHHVSLANIMPTSPTLYQGNAPNMISNCHHQASPTTTEDHRSIPHEYHERNEFGRQQSVSSSPHQRYQRYGQYPTGRGEWEQQDVSMTTASHYHHVTIPLLASRSPVHMYDQTAMYLPRDQTIQMSLPSGQPQPPIGSEYGTTAYALRMTPSIISTPTARQGSASRPPISNPGTAQGTGGTGRSTVGHAANIGTKSRHAPAPTKHNTGQSTTTPTTRETKTTRRRRRPNESYFNIIIKAIRSSPIQRLKLSEIYEYVSREIPHMNGDDKGWQNTVRHNLSHNKCFRRVVITDTEPSPSPPQGSAEAEDESRPTGSGMPVQPQQPSQQLQQPQQTKKGRGGFWVLVPEYIEESMSLSRPKKSISEKEQCQQKQPAQKVGNSMVGSDNTVFSQERQLQRQGEIEAGAEPSQFDQSTSGGSTSTSGSSGSGSGNGSGSGSSGSVAPLAAMDIGQDVASIIIAEQDVSSLDHSEFHPPASFRHSHQSRNNHGHQQKFSTEVGQKDSNGDCGSDDEVFSTKSSQADGSEYDELDETDEDIDVDEEEEEGDRDMDGAGEILSDDSSSLMDFESEQKDLDLDNRAARMARLAGPQGVGQESLTVTPESTYALISPPTSASLTTGGDRRHSMSIQNILN